MLTGRAAQNPQSVLKPLRQGDETLAAEHGMGMLKAGIRQPEVLEPVRQRRTCDDDAGLPHVGEIRQADPARLV